MLEKKNYELSIWMVQEIFIIFKLCHGVEGGARESFSSNDINE
jgi:hypothetical protein